MSSIFKLWRKLSNPEYRRAFVASQISIGIPYQIRALARARGWSQAVVAAKCGMAQPRVSALMRPGNTRPNIRTLSRIASAFDCALLVRFVPFSELAVWSENFDPDSFDAKPFTRDELPAHILMRTGTPRVETEETGHRSRATYAAWARKTVTTGVNYRVLTSSPKHPTIDDFPKMSTIYAQHGNTDTGGRYYV